MLSFKKRIVVGVALLVLLIATILPVGAEDSNASTSPSPANGTSSISIQIGGLNFAVSLLSLPIRCGNNC